MDGQSDTNRNNPNSVSWCFLFQVWEDVVIEGIGCGVPEEVPIWTASELLANADAGSRLICLLRFSPLDTYSMYLIMTTWLYITYCIRFACGIRMAGIAIQWDVYTFEITLLDLTSNETFVYMSIISARNCVASSWSMALRTSCRKSPPPSQRCAWRFPACPVVAIDCCKKRKGMDSWFILEKYRLVNWSFDFGQLMILFTFSNHIIQSY